MGKKLVVGFSGLTPLTKEEKEQMATRKTNSVARQIFSAVKGMTSKDVDGKKVVLSDRLEIVQLRSLSNSINQLLKANGNDFKTRPYSDDKMCAIAFVRSE